MYWIASEILNLFNRGAYPNWVSIAFVTWEGGVDFSLFEGFNWLSKSFANDRDRVSRVSRILFV